jgi:hypothetical protein
MPSQSSSTGALLNLESLVDVPWCVLDPDGDATPRGPGRGKWTPVPKAQVASEYGLDPYLLARAALEIDRAYATGDYAPGL